MVLTEQELHPPVILPGVEDRATTARVASFVCWLAALWFFLSPWAFFGVSEQRSGWNGWIVGGVMVIVSMLRLLAPRETTPLAIVNMVLGAWTLASPWIFGYTVQTSRTYNSVGTGACVLAFSVVSYQVSRQLLRIRPLNVDASE